MLLEFEHVTGTNRHFHVEDVSFALEPGYIMGLAGKNGAGKTTLLHHILDKKKSYEGTIRLMGEDIHRDHNKTLDRIGFVSDENFFLMNNNAQENGEMYGSFYTNWSKEIFDEALERMEISRYKLLKSLSRGEFIKFQMAFAMAHRPALYILDEATAGMDPMFRREFFKLLLQLIESEEASVLMTTHSMEEMEKKMDYIGILEKGRLVSFQESGEM